MQRSIGTALVVLMSSGTVFAGGFGDDNFHTPSRWLGYANAGSGPGYYPPPAFVSPYRHQTPPAYYWNHWDRHPGPLPLANEWQPAFDPVGNRSPASDENALKKRWKRYRNDWDANR